MPYKVRDVVVRCTGCGATVTNKFRVSQKQAKAGFASLCAACYIKKH